MSGLSNPFSTIKTTCSLSYCHGNKLRQIRLEDRIDFGEVFFTRFRKQEAKDGVFSVIDFPQIEWPLKFRQHLVVIEGSDPASVYTGGVVKDDDAVQLSAFVLQNFVPGGPLLGKNR